MKYDLSNFIYFINERESIRIKRECGEPYPWTDDVVLRETKFTNIDRNEDYGTKRLFSFIENKNTDEKIFYIIFYRCFYSVRTFFDQVSGDIDTDLSKAERGEFRVGMPLTYQILLDKNQTINKFLRRTACNVYSHITSEIDSYDNISIKQATDVIIEYFKNTDSKRQVFLATEIAKDLSVIFSDKINPSSECYLNSGARNGLRLLEIGSSDKISLLIEKTGLNYSQLEHALCEYSKYIKRKEFFKENKTFRKVWLYKRHVLSQESLEEY